MLILKKINWIYVLISSTLYAQCTAELFLEQQELREQQEKSDWI